MGGLVLFKLINRDSLTFRFGASLASPPSSITWPRAGWPPTGRDTHSDQR